MASNVYVGTGGNAGSAVSSLYRAAGSKEPESDITYVVGIKEKAANGDFVQGSRNADYAEALKSAMNKAGIGGYDPERHSLEVEARANFAVATKAAAGGAGPSNRNGTTLTDLF